MTHHWLRIYSPRDGLDDYAAERRVMADVRAYFQVSYKVPSAHCVAQYISLWIGLPLYMQRVIDHVPLTIEQELTQTFASNIHDTLLQKLVGGPEAPTVERMKELLEEDPVMTARRNILQERRDRLVEIKRRLDRFMD
jgi:hypothetical protein